MDFVLLPGISSFSGDLCGKAIVPPGWKHQKRNMDTSVLIFGDYGSLLIQEAKTTLSIQPSSFCLLSAAKTHFSINKTTEKTS